MTKKVSQTSSLPTATHYITNSVKVKKNFEPSRKIFVVKQISSSRYNSTKSNA